LVSFSSLGWQFTFYNIWYIILYSADYYIFTKAVQKIAAASSQ